MRSCRFIVAGLLLALLVGRAPGQETASDQQGQDQQVSAAERFAQLETEWRALGQKRREIQAQFARVPEAERQGVIDAFIKTIEQTQQIFADLRTAADAAYRADPKNKHVEEFLALVALRSFEGDRLEDAFELLTLLLDNGSEYSFLPNHAGIAALEMADLDSAQKYLELAQLKKSLDKTGAACLAKLSEFREVVEHEKAVRAAEAKSDDLPRVVLKTTAGDIVIELFEDDAPNTVANFIHLVQEGFYDGQTFFRVVRGFGATAGCPNGDGTGDDGYRILREDYQNNEHVHLRGYVSMVTTKHGTAGSQFFIAFRPTTASQLNKQQTVFGEVIQGLDIVTELPATDPRQRANGLRPREIIEAKVLRRRNHAYVPVTTRELATKELEEGLKLGAQNKIDEAMEHFQKGLQLDPHFALLHHNIGIAQLQQNNLEAAERSLREAVRLDDSLELSHFALANVLVNREKKEEAIVHLEIALKLNPNLDEARRKLKRLRDG